MEKINTLEDSKNNFNIKDLVNKISNDNKLNWDDKKEILDILEKYNNDKISILKETKDSLNEAFKKTLEGWFLIKNENDFLVLKQILRIIWNNSNLWEFDKSQINHVIWLKNDELFLWKNNISGVDALWTSYIKKLNNWVWIDNPLDIELQLNKNSFKKDSINIPISTPIFTINSNEVSVEESLDRWEEIVNEEKLEKVNIKSNPIVKKVIVKASKNKEKSQTITPIQPTEKTEKDIEENEIEKITLDISSWITIENKEQYDRIKKSFKLPDWEKLPNEIKNKNNSQILTLAENKEKQVIDLYFWEKRINDIWQEYVMKYWNIVNWEFKKSSFFERNFSWDNLENNVKI